MRRPAAPPSSLLVLGLGVFLLVLAPMLAWYVEPRADRTPTDVNQTTVFKGTGTYYDAEAGENRDDQEITVTRRVLGDVAASEDSGHAIWDVSTTIDTPDTLELNDPRRSFKWTKERWITDRDTNRPVHCCGEDTGGAADEYRGEAYLKFPANVEKRSYRWWDGSLNGVVTLAYKGEKTIEGYEGLRFTGKVAPVRTGTRQVPGVVVGLEDRAQVFAEEYYANTHLELVVDQRTGRILYASTAPKVTLRQPGGGTTDEVTLLQSDGIAFTKAIQKAQVELAEDDTGKLELIGTTIPISGAVLGFILVGVGAWLLIRRGPVEEQEENESRRPYAHAAP